MIEPTIVHTQSEHTNYYTTDGVPVTDDNSKCLICIVLIHINLSLRKV